MKRLYMNSRVLFLEGGFFGEASLLFGLFFLAFSFFWLFLAELAGLAERYSVIAIYLPHIGDGAISILYERNE